VAPERGDPGVHGQAEQAAHRALHRPQAGQGAPLQEDLEAELLVLSWRANKISNESFLIKQVQPAGLHQLATSAP